MTNLIEQRMAMAHVRTNPYVIARVSSGWLAIGDHQMLPGYCLLLADPVVQSLNALDEPARIRYSLDMIRAGDALVEATGAYRINYLTMCDREPSLNTHLVARYLSEPEDKRRDNALRAHDRATARRTDPRREDRDFMEKMRRALTQ